MCDHDFQISHSILTSSSSILNCSFILSGNVTINPPGTIFDTDSGLFDSLTLQSGSCNYKSRDSVDLKIALTAGTLRISNVLNVFPNVTRNYLTPIFYEGIPTLQYAEGAITADIAEFGVGDM
jgi:hypothetical protein